MNTFQEATDEQLLEARAFAGFNGYPAIVRRCEHELNERNVPFRAVD